MAVYNPPASGQFRKVPMTNKRALLLALLTAFSAISLGAQSAAPQPDWKAVEVEAMRHYQELIRFDTSATERAAAEYLKEVLGQNGIAAQILFKDPERP